jgi:hypothetical protein
MTAFHQLRKEIGDRNGTFKVENKSARAPSPPMKRRLHKVEENEECAGPRLR